MCRFVGWWRCSLRILWIISKDNPLSQVEHLALQTTDRGQDQVGDLVRWHHRQPCRIALTQPVDLLRHDALGDAFHRLPRGPGILLSDPA
jgi:hypothetical protein